MSLAPSASTLTKYKPGSLKEVWALTWPLMLSYFSLSLMLFTDRSFLAKMDANALHAGLKTSFVYFLIAMIPMAIAGVSEVIVGKLNGAGLHMKIGGVFWACLSLAAAVLPLALFAGLYVTDFLFDPSGLEAQYFRPLILFLPFQILTVALSGWYIGMGYVRVITYSTAAGACVNIFLDWALIFGNCGFPQMGITGAAIGTGLSLAFQSLCLLFLALGSAKYYAPYCTRLIKGSFKDIKAYLKEFCTIGFAPGLGQWFEILGQNCFFFLITLMGQEQLTLAAIAQSFYLLLMFVGLAINKTSATLCANAIGAKNFSVVNRALKNCVLFLTLAFTCVFLLVWGVSQPLLELFLSERDFLAIETDPSLKTHCFWTLIACCFFFYFDAMAWTLQGVLIAKSDTKIIFWTSLCSFWGIVVLPLSLIVFYTNYHYAFLGWGLLTLATLVNSTVLFCRHRACPLAA